MFENFCIFASAIMIFRRCHIILFLACLLLLSCDPIVRDGKRLQKTLNGQMQTADDLTRQLASHLGAANFDSIWQVSQNTDNILFYIFKNQRMVFWSDSWLSGYQILLDEYDTWFYRRFDNAHAICRWSRAEGYNLLTVIPIRYCYKIENNQLRNTFIPPFHHLQGYDITYVRQDDSYSLVSDKGTYLFCLYRQTEKPATTIANDKLAQSFSYRSLMDDDGDSSASTMPWSWVLYLSLAIVALIIVIGIVGLIRNRGIRNMRLRTKLMYMFLFVQLVAFFYLFIMSINYVNRHYKTRQRTELLTRAKYIQKALQLQDAYYWQMSLSTGLQQNLNVDLQDLSFTYLTDIHVYDLNGNLVGTSAPAIFEQGLISQHIAPEVFFSKQPEMLREEHIGGLKYLCAYTEFVNGSYLPIGYISVPLYLSTDEVNAEVDNFLSKLFIPYIFILLLIALLSFFFARGLTRPLDILSNKMRHFRIGHHDNHLQYNNQDEIGELVVRYNEMVDELEDYADRLARSEREGAWRTMARQIAHEINNPLTPMKLTIQQLQRTRGTDRFQEYFARSTNMLIEQIDNLSRIAQSFSQFAKMPEVVTTEVDIAQKLFSVVQLFRSNQNDVNIRYIGAETGVMVLADAEQISQVFSNLLKNALQATENRDDGDIIVMLKPQSADPQYANMVEITVSDNGAGIPDDIRDKIFMPNFTTKSTGMGLGLAISKNIIEGSAGHISFQTSDKGTTFFVHLKLIQN